jgi:RND family efflux transporter MFP subunit
VGRFADETDDDKPMFVIENIDKLQMKVLVNETDIAKVEVGQKVEITADILDGESVEGVVSRISPTGESKDTNSTERVIPVYIEVVGTNEKLIAGITAKATIHIAKAEQALTVPYEAVSELEDGSTVVYVVNEDNTIQIVPVTIGLETDLLIQIQEGELTEGQQIVLNPSLALTEGMTVIPQ